jgi:two-component system, NarL family, nitrate/nitrite response regulator NarL
VRQSLAFRSSQAPETAEASPDALTPRELEVLAWIGTGFSNREIAERLVLSEGTIRAHMRNILGKLRLVNRTQAALYAVQHELHPTDGSPPVI